MKKSNYPGVTVKRIRRLAFSVNDILIKPNTTFTSEFGLHFGFSIESNLLDFTVDSQIRYPGASENLARITVQNLYEVPHLRKYRNADSISIPPGLLSLLVGMSISHTRALFASDLSGTRLGEHSLPIVDAEDMARHFFPLMFHKPRSGNRSSKKAVSGKTL